MSIVSSLQKHQQEQKYTQLVDRVAELTALAQPEFDALVSSGKIIGKWEDKTWKYRNKVIYFTRPFDNSGNLVTSKTPSENKVAIEGIWADVYRLFILHKIKGHNGNPKTVSNLIGCTAWLGEYYQYDIAVLHKLNQDRLDALVPMLESKFRERGPFERYKTIVSFVKKFLIPNKLCRSFAPSVNMKNPALARADVTSKASAKAREDKFIENIDGYIGLVKQRFDEDVRRLALRKPAKYPEPLQGYDELRLLAMPFFLALGLRIGEVCRLHKDCLGYDGTTCKWFLRVLTEKGELANARPIPRKWQDVIIRSYERILKLTEQFRAFAKDVEERGESAFVDVLDFPDRHPITSEALEKQGYPSDAYFLISEIGKSGDVHQSGLAYNAVRIRKDKDGNDVKRLYADAIVDEIKAKLKPESITTRKIVISKSKVASVAMEYYRGYQQRVYQENKIDGEISETISSTSYQVKMPFSDFLFIVKDDTFSSASKSHGFVPRPMLINEMSNWLAEDSSRSKSVFTRYDIRDADNKIVNITSHQFRHWVTTALLRSGKNESMVDLFMGRKAGQTRHYDHRTPKERAEGIRSKYLSETPPDDVLGRRVKRMRENGVSLSEIENALSHTLSVLHYTPWGTCNRDLDVSPCEKGMMCLRGEEGQGCQHFGIDPDDEEAKQSIINTKTHYETQLSVLLPNYENLLYTLNRQEPLDQHVQYCIDTIEGCDSALRAYERANLTKDNTIPIVQVFMPEESV
jgi:integrase